MGVLDEILAHKAEEIEALRARALPNPPPTRPVELRRSTGQRLGLIAEIKRRSPSAGLLSTALQVGPRARAYEAAGASMVSVLCDARFFDGSYEHLQEARQACALPLLCKDFILDEIQLETARAHGADAALLIVRCIGPNRLASLIEASQAHGLTPLVEVVDETESRAALDAGADLIGVNARNLDTLAMDPSRAALVLEALPTSVTKVHLSGLRTPRDVRQVARGPADAALVGEALMRLDDPTALLREMNDAAGR